MIKIERSALEELFQALYLAWPNEGCGFVAGKGDVATKVYPVRNVLASPVAYRMDGEAQVAAWYEMEERGERPIAIYHSHPQGRAYPSETDIAEATFDLPYVIVALSPAPKVRAFRLENAEIHEISVKIE